MKCWMVTYTDKIGRTRKMWFRAKTLIHACATARRLMNHYFLNNEWTIANVERRC